MNLKSQIIFALMLVLLATGLVWMVELVSSGILMGYKLIIAVAIVFTAYFYIGWKWIKRRQGQLLTLLKMSGLSLVTVDRQGVVVDCNDRYVTLIGFRSPDEVVGNSVFDWTAPESRRHCLKAVEECIKEGAVKSFPFTLVSTDGSQFDIVGSAVLRESGRVPNVTILCRDITAHKASENRLIASRDLYKGIFESSRDAYYRVSMDGKLLLASPSMAEMLGWSSVEEMDGVDVKTAFYADPMDREILLDAIAEDGKLRDYETIFKHRDGSTLTVSVNAQYIRDKSGAVIGIEGLISDISDRHRFERQILREIHRRILLADLLEVSLQTADKDELLKTSLEVILSQRLMQLKDRGAIFLLERDKRKLMHVSTNNLDEKKLIECEAIFDTSCLCGRAVSFGETQFTLDGEAKACNEFSIRGHFSVPIRSDGEVIGVILLYHDEGAEYSQEDASLLTAVSDIIAGALKRLDAEQSLRQHSANLERVVQVRTSELERTLADLEAAYQGKSEFLANMSHELRTPMHAVLSFAQFGKKKINTVPREKLLEYFQHIIDSGDRMLELVNDLLDLAKLEAGKMDVQFANHDLEQLVKESIREMEGRAHEAKVNINLLEHAMPVEGEFDSLRISQVLRNLLSNAIKFSPRGGSVSVAVSESEITSPSGERLDALVVEVVDRGVGVPQDEQKMVFEKFAQSSRTKTGAGGTGLGLSISKEIIEAHRGEIWVEAFPFGGASFRFAIPKHQMNEERRSVSVS
ncbi:MAG: PAS domain S-box protein [Gammaproteobacteria bacterium]|nr:PAS domain S-box protein [Gammaproteobacteria bacterium]